MASLSLTWASSAPAFRMSSLTNVAAVGCTVSSHFRFLSVPGRLRLSTTVTCQPRSIMCAAALTPMKPAPPVMSARRVLGIDGYVKAPNDHPYHRDVSPTQPSSGLSEPDVRSVRSNWAAEARMAAVYASLASVCADARMRDHLKVLAATEKRHADAWAEVLSSRGVKVPDRSPHATARVLAALARVVGIGPALALAGAAEGQVLRAYLSQVSTVADAH